MARMFFGVLLFSSLLALPAPAQEAAIAEVEPAPEAVRDYVIGPGDLLEIAVYDAPDLSREVRVSVSGMIMMPLLPEPVRADGRTAEELAAALAEEFEKRQILRHPQVTVLVKEYKSRPVAVVGAVREPRMIPVFGPMTLLEVLSEAKGLAEDAGSLIFVTRGARLRQLPDSPQEVNEPKEFGPRTLVVNVRDLMEASDPAANVPIYAGDLVTVPRAGVIYVVGAVKKPGGFLLRERNQQVTVLQALALAEYVTSTAQPSKAVIVRRQRGAEEETIPVDVAKILARGAPDQPMMENDILFIPDSQFKRGMAHVGKAVIQIVTGIAIWGTVR